MTTKEVAVVDPSGDIVEETMSKRDATALNKKISTMSEKVATNAFELLSLIEQAAAGNIHLALGYKSWTEWYSENVQIDVSDKDERKMLAQMMSGKGMSQRAIAASLGIGQATVSRDLEGDSNGSPVTGLDGKTYKKDNDFSEGDIIDAEVVEGEVLQDDPADEDSAPARRSPLPAAFDGVIDNLMCSITDLMELTEDDRFAKGHKGIAKKHTKNITAFIENLSDVSDKLAV